LSPIQFRGSNIRTGAAQRRNTPIVNWIKNGDPGQRVLWLNNTDLRLEVDHIPSNLRPGIDVRRAVALPANQRPKVAFQGQTPGVTKGFTLDAAGRAALICRDLRSARARPHGAPPPRSSSDPEEVRPKEAAHNAESRAANSHARGRHHHSGLLDSWWMQAYRRTDMIEAFDGLDRFIATSRVASEKRTTVFKFVDASVRLGDSLTAFALDDNYSFGILSSGLHRLWFEARCSTLKADLRYTSTTVFDSFPWPQAPTTPQVNTIEKIVADLLQVRDKNLAAGMSLARQYDTLRQPARVGCEPCTPTSTPPS
jgi:hypothetical protein